MAVQLLIINKPYQNARKRGLAKFLYYFKLGYNDPIFVDWERQYKLNAHKKFQHFLNRESYSDLLKAKKYHEIANLAVKIESGTNLLFSFEKMALRDAVKSAAGAKLFAIGLFDYLYGTSSLKDRFEAFVMIIRCPSAQANEGADMAHSCHFWIYWKSF